VKRNTSRIIRTLKFTGAWDGKKGIEAKAEAAYQVKIPMLVGEGPLMSGNNLKLKTQIGVSPIAASATLDAVLTPIAVLEISLGGGAGTGWDLPLMSLEGLRIASGPIGSPLTSDQLAGTYYMGRAGAAFQFDTGAILKGDWTSVVIRAYQELNYKGYTGAQRLHWSNRQHHSLGIREWRSNGQRLQLQG